MKKLTLFLVAMFAMVNVANAQRAWAYDLELTPSVDSYTFAFKAVTAGDATLVFYKEGVEAGTLNLGSVSAGDNTVTKTSEELLGAIQQSGDFTWGVKMTGSAIAAGSTLTEVGSADFYNMMGVVVDNNPESSTFSQIYIQQAYEYTSGTTAERNKSQKAGIFIYDQQLNELNNPNNKGIVPNVPDAYKAYFGKNRDAMKRLAINPKTGQLAFCYNITLTGQAAAVWAMDLEELTPTAGSVTTVNLIDGITAFSKPNSLCFGEDGTLFVLADGGYSSTLGSLGTIYKIVDGTATAFSTFKYANGENAIASDGKGGLWVAQQRNNLDGFSAYTHHKADGEVDYTVTNKSSDEVKSLFQHTADYMSKRGAIAYDVKRDILAVGGDKKVILFSVAYDATTGSPTLTKLLATPTIGSNIDGIAFDYAGDLYVVSSSSEEFQKFVVPTNNNTCTVPAKKAQVITLVSATPEYNVTINVNGNGTVTGANMGTYLEGTELTLTATPAEHYEFTGWTGDVTSTDNPLTVTVNSDVTITANFEKQKHILTVFVNDENKGTIDVATDSHEYGTEVILTATPKPGYKLLAWSNKATTPSITLTMDNNKAVSAYFVKEYATDPTFTIEKVWENTINIPGTGNGYQAVGWDGKIYMQDADNKKIKVFSNGTDEAAEYASSGAGQQIAVDGAGNLIVFNAYFASAAPNAILIYEEGTTTGKEVSFTLPQPGRCDFFTASGDIYSASGGYIYFYCNGTTVVNRLKITNGAATAADVTTDVICANLPGAGTQSNVVVDIFGNIHVESKQKSPGVYNITNLTTTTDTHLGGAGKNTLYSTIGGCTFELGGKEWWAYLAGSTNYSSEWQLYNETDGSCLSNELYLTATRTTAGATANWLNAQVVDEKTAYIYQFCPKVGVALWKVSFQENYIVSASATNGTVKGAGTYQEGATATLTATPNTGYKFVNWTKGGVEVSTEATYSFPVTENVELVANFEAIASKDPRAWAYDMKLGEDGDNYTFTFKATAAGQATISFKDKDGNALAQPASQTKAAVVGENKFTIAKSDFESGVDAFWSITMDGAPIEGVVEVTDQSRGIYDFYNMMGVVVDNNTDSKDFGKIYIQQSYQRSYASSSTSNNGITTRANNQTSGIFIYNQDLDELNDPSNVGYKPTLPSGYEEIGSSYSTFQRLNIDPKTGNLVFSHAVSGNPAVFAINRDDMTGDVTNLLTGVADMTRSVAHCFDVDGTLFVMNFADNKGTIYKVINGEATKFTETSGRFINANITIASDGRGGFWISQNRGQIDYYYQLAHVTSAGAIDWSVYDDHGTYVAPQGDNPGKLGTSSLGWLGSSSRGALAYDAERNILAQGRNGKVELYTVSYEPTITLTPLHTIASNGLGNNIDGLAFDYAGDLYVVNSSKEKFQKFTLPTADNICTVAAPALEAVRFTPVYTVSVASNNNEWGIANGGGTFEEGETATITAVAETNYKFVKWIKDGAEEFTENPYAFAVTESATYVAHFVEKTKYTIDVIIVEDAKMGTVTGVGSYYEGTEVTLTAKANGGYVFVKWSDEVTDESRTITASEDVTLQAIFKVATPRAWAYDLRLDADTDPANYIFTFKTTSAGTATLIFKDKNGNTLDFGAHTATATTAEEKTITIAKTVFDAATKDIYWEVELAGEAIAKMAEITDPTRNIYDFYNMMGVVVDNDPNSEMFGKIYIQQSYNGAADGIADRSDTQTAGIFIYDQGLNELNNPANVGIKPQLPYTIGANRQVFKRITINPSNGDIAFCNNTTTDGGAYAVSRENLAGEAINLTKHISEIQKVNALCFDDEGNLYVVANVSTSGTPNGNIYQIKTDGTYTELTSKGGNLFYDQEIAMASDGRGGLWIAQNRWGTIAGTLFHVNVAENKIDFKVEADKEYSDWFAGANYRGAIAYDKQRDILAVHSQACASVFQVTYAADGVPSISKICQTPNLGMNELDGLAFDYAGDLYVVNSGTERFYKYVLPTNNNNTCTVPAPESQIIKKEARHTVTVVANPEEMGTVSGGGTEFLAGDIATLTATANDGYRFVNWTYGITTSTDNPLELTVEGDITVTAHFEAKPLAIEGTVKRAVQIGESTVVLTHEADGTPHLYKVVDGELEAEISQEGVIARDPENLGDYLSISDIAATEDGKLVAINKIVCQSDEGQVIDGYKRGEIRVYKWDNIDGTPSVWFTSKQSSNWFKSIQGHTMAYKGTSTTGTLFTTGVTATGEKFRYSVYNVIDGVYDGEDNNNNTYFHFTKGSAQTTTALGENYELNASPLATTNWILDGGEVEPFEIIDPLTYNTEVIEGTKLADNTLGKKFNGATYLTVLGKHLMVAPYADGEDVAGVTVLDITNGLDQAEDIDYAELTTPLAATAAATAVKVNGDDLTITLVVDNDVYVFNIDLNLQYTRIVTSGDFGTICLPYGSSSYNGAEFYEIAYLELQADGVTPKGIWLDEAPFELEAGKPYIFKATSNLLTVNYKGEEALSPVVGKAGLTGTFDGITDESVLEGNYMINQNKFWLCGTGCWLNANRAYIEHDALHATTTPVSPIPGRRRVMMGAAGENTTTGVNNLTEGGAIAPNVEGTYDVLGRKMNEPNNTGFYIVNGKKVVIVK